MQTVAAASEEMTLSIREIARNATDAAKAGRDAVMAAGRANATIERLGESSTEIDNVVKLITSIAAQTNLLALNATIEAARAGDSGKGFAVVAGEVKELAQESAKAAETISQRIENIQSETGEAVSAIGGIGKLIAHINEDQTTIASAVEEQTVTSDEMSRSITEAATGTRLIERDIVVVSEGTRATAQEVASTECAATDLARLSAELRQLVGTFTT